MKSIARKGVVIGLLVMVQVASALPIASQATHPINPVLQRLATATQTDGSRLTLVESADFTLLDGTALTRVKAEDRDTGETVGGTLKGDQLVDETALRAAAASVWRAQHGAVTPELLKMLQTMQPNDTLQVSAWLAVDAQPLPRPELVRPAKDEGIATSADVPPADAAPKVIGADGKGFAVNTPADKVPADLAALLALPARSGESAPAEADSKQGAAQSNIPDNTAIMARAEQLKQQNIQHLRAQVKPAVDSFAAQMQQRGVTVLGSDEMAPTVVLQLTRAQLEEIAMLPEIDTLYAIPPNAGASMGYARPTQLADIVEYMGGYTGAGVKVAVAEGERAFFANPYLTLVGSYDGSQPYATHPTGVSGIIRSTHPTVRGIATGVDLYSANGSYSNWTTMQNALNYATTNAKVINNSWYWDFSNTATFWEADRRLDYYVRTNWDFVTVASGNFGNGCGGNFSSYVVSPAKGYNVMTVGNYDDLNSLGWSGDAMNNCSSFGDPGADAATPKHSKPEVAAVGSGISSTIDSIVTPIGGIGSGTSYAAPMIAGLAANMIQADANLTNWPEAIKAVIMATAMHNIEGSERYSDKDGAGGMVATAAMVSVERDNWDAKSVTSASFPMTYTQYAHKGERVRFVVAWDSNPNSGFTTDPLEFDIDLYAYRANGTTVISTSTSGVNNFEIVDFIAPASETYRFIVRRFSSTGSSTFLGVGWWRGVYRISPDTAYTDPKATPLGTHLAVYPTDWSPTGDWRAMGVRSSSSDHDLELYTRSMFSDPSLRSFKRGSYYGTNDVDVIAVDGNHWLTSNPEHYVVDHWTGTGGYNVNWSNQALVLDYGLYGPYTLGGNGVVKVYDVLMQARRAKRIYVLPSGNSNDLASLLFKSSSGDSNTWAQSRGSAYRSSDRGTAANTAEWFDAINSTASSDYFGLVVYGKNTATSNYYIYIIPNTVSLPRVLKP